MLTSVSSLKIQSASTLNRPQLMTTGIVLAIFDAAALLICFLAGVWGLVYYGHYANRPEDWQIWLHETGYPHLVVYCFFVAMTLVGFWMAGLYSKRYPFWDELAQILRNLLFISLMHGIVVLAARWPFSKFVWLTSWVGAMILIPVVRCFSKSLLRSFKQWQIPTVILGAGPNALAAYRALQSEPSMGFEVLGFLTINGKIDLPAPVTSIGKEDLFPTLQAMNQPHVVFAIEQNYLHQHQDIIQSLTLRYPSFSWIPDIAGLPLLGMEINHFFSHEVLLLNVRNNLASPLAQATKRMLDILGSGFLLITLSPLFLYLAWQIKKTKGPAIFSHRRVGRKGEMFQCYKFRTMVTDADAVLRKILDSDPVARKQWETEFKLKDDPRITPIGGFLRRSSLDELPQLWNVFVGEMSLVGPRPVTEGELKLYEEKVSYYLAARPGLTGLWQVSGRNELSYAARTSLDAWYVKNWNIWYDVAILFKTIKVVFGRKGAY